MSLPKILFVDDEPNVLIGVSRSLRREFEILMATSGEEGLQRLAAQDIDVVVSDMRMPGMDGAAFLTRARALVPDTVRLVMSGHSDLEASVRAINEGNVFRFLVKPVAREQLAEVIGAAVAQRRLVLAERELLERTLLGAVEALSEGLAIASPLAFGRGRRLRQLVSSLADQLHLSLKWTLEVAAMLSQLGAGTLPREMLERWYGGDELSAADRTLVAQANALTCRQVRHIPRLEPVLELLSALVDDAPAASRPLPARVLLVADAIERRLSRGEPVGDAVKYLEESGRFDPLVLNACRELGGLLSGEDRALLEVPITRLKEGMVLADDVYSRNGALLIARGHNVTETVMLCLRNFYDTVGVREPLKVLVPREVPPA